MKKSPQLKWTYLAIASTFFSSVCLTRNWYTWVVSQLLDSKEFWLTTSWYLHAYEAWKQTKPFWRKLWWDELWTVFQSQKSDFYSIGNMALSVLEAKRDIFLTAVDQIMLLDSPIKTQKYAWK